MIKKKKLCPDERDQISEEWLHRSLQATDRVSSPRMSQKNTTIRMKGFYVQLKTITSNFVNERAVFPFHFTIEQEVFCESVVRAECSTGTSDLRSQWETDTQKCWMLMHWMTIAGKIAGTTFKNKVTITFESTKKCLTSPFSWKRSLTF